MYLKPKRTKYNKSHKGRISFVPTLKNWQDLQSFDYTGQSKKTTSLLEHHLALISLEPQRLTAAQIYAVELAIKRLFKREGKLILRTFPDIPVTKKPAQMRMGKGKGNVDHWIARIRKGSCILELFSKNSILAEKALKIAASKLPMSSKVIKLNSPKAGLNSHSLLFLLYPLKRFTNFTAIVPFTL